MAQIPPESDASPEVYSDVAAMEPMLPAKGRKALAELTMEIARKTGELNATLPSEITKNSIRNLVAEMNSYYSNLIEGHKTYPRDIEKALKDDFSHDPVKRDNQLLARAHIEVEKQMIERLEAEPELNIHSESFLCWLHKNFYERLPETLHFAKTKSGNPYRIVPGEIRDFQVDVGRHIPPHSEALPKFLKRFESCHSSPQIFETNRLVAIAAAHHRLVWIHPFGDGNGRVSRLYSEASLIRYGYSDRSSLWTLSRGLARSKARYFEHLMRADARRRNDWDGRGNLSDAELSAFCSFFLTTILGQITFMQECLALEKLSGRIEEHIRFKAIHLKKDADRLIRLLQELLFKGEMPRGKVSGLLGVADSTARLVIQIAVKEELVTSSTPNGPIRLAFPSKLLESYFPGLFLDLPV